MDRFHKIKEFFRRGFSIPWYFIVFSAYPVLALLSSNAGQVKLGAGWRPLLISAIFAGLLFTLLIFLLRDIYRAAFLTTLWLVFFFSYGHVHIMLTEKWEDVNFTPWLLSAWLTLAVLSYIWATRPRFSFRDAVLPLNVISLGLVVTSLVQISSGVQEGDGHYVAAENAPVQDLVRPQDPPDVYYFILDSYGREDLLEQAYGYDNSAFLDGLRERGFYIAKCSQSNYVRTEVSLTSSLNMSYLQELDPAFKPDSTRRGVLWDSLKHSAVRYNFENMGYKTVGFATGFAWNELEDAHVFLIPDSFAAGISEFEALFMRTTLARQVDDLGWLDADANMGRSFRDRTLNVFERIDDIARMPEPTFAYIHLIPPHPPFVFGPEGEPRQPAEFWNENREYPPGPYAEGYQNQMTYINKRMLEAIDAVLSESKTPPIIIVQGDHGPWLQPKEKRFWILNAYYLPQGYDHLYPTITPVNTFRLVFNSYFGGRYDMLPDISYFSPVPKLYEFSEVPNRCR
ncbi:MAG TPA: sulfatase-like hydrolase/transferase [Anaerolineales bacterium]|nr:sulfatase-like hydrolase/transferase [Anaerolineales bacterium]